jgi:hypothetical protein
MTFGHAISSRMPCWSHKQWTHQGPWRHRRLRSDLTWYDPTAMWTYNFLRAKHFHGVSSGNQHPYWLTSRYGKVSHFSPDGLTVAKKTLANFVARVRWFYEQEPGGAAAASRLGTYVQRRVRWVTAGVRESLPRQLPMLVGAAPSVWCVALSGGRVRRVATCMWGLEKPQWAATIPPGRFACVRL